MYETEVFCETGSWRSIDELEEWITLEELFELYGRTLKRQTRMMKSVAAAFGADVSFDEDEEYVKPDQSLKLERKGWEHNPKENQTITGNPAEIDRLKGAGIGIGYNGLK